MPRGPLEELETYMPYTYSWKSSILCPAKKEFKTTAAKVSTSPWHMQRAADWLSKLLAANENGWSPTWVPPPIPFVVAGAKPQLVADYPISQVLPTATHYRHFHKADHAQATRGATGSCPKIEEISA